MLGLLKHTTVVGRLRAAWRHEAEDAIKPVRKELRRLARDVEQLQALLREASARAAHGDRLASQLRAMLDADTRQRDLIERWPQVFDAQALAAHVDAAVAAAELQDDPFPHVVVHRLLPDAAYDMLLAAIPPAVFFDDHDPVKQDLAVPMAFGPALATRTWNFVDAVLGRGIIQRAVLARFREPLQRHYDEVFGPEFSLRARELPYVADGGRLMLRRAGYCIPPHRDPKRALLTCLMYLARPGDSNRHGTQLYRVFGDEEAPFKQTYYPDAAGRRCELVKSVPFLANAMLVFLNSRGAHGAAIPEDAGAGVERYAYQFYVAPENAALGTLIRDLPPHRRERWQNRNRLAPSARPAKGAALRSNTGAME